MKIAIIGSGNVGGTLAKVWANAGHQIYLGVRDKVHFKGEALLKVENISLHSISDAVKTSEVILVATPSHIATDLVKAFGEVKDKVIIDSSNSVMKSPHPYPTAFHAFEALTKAEVVKCFNTTGFENMEDTQYGELKLDMFMAGNSTKAKAVASQLSQDAGFEHCYDFGPSDKVELLEKFALSWINLAIMQGMGRNIGFKLLKR